MDILFSDLYSRIYRSAERQLADERPGHTLEAAELVNEAYLRLRDVRGQDWQDKGHVLRLIARAIRHVLIDWARKKNAVKHGGGARMVTLVTSKGKTATPIEDIIALDAALTELANGPGKLPREAQVVELYFYVGATPAEIAKALDVTERQVYRDYRHARVWLHQKLTG